MKALRSAGCLALVVAVGAVLLLAWPIVAGAVGILTHGVSLVVSFLAAWPILLAVAAPVIIILVWRWWQRRRKPATDDGALALRGPLTWHGGTANASNSVNIHIGK